MLTVHSDSRNRGHVKTWRSWFVDAVLIAIALVVAGYAVNTRLPKSSLVTRSEWRQLAEGHSIGDSSGSALVVAEFVDYQCPFCARSESTVFGSSAESKLKIRRVVHHFPLPMHPAALPAAQAAECAGRSGEFARMHNILYALQDSLNRIDFLQLARRIGVTDTASFQRCMSDAEILSSIQRDVALGVAIGVRGTPAYVVNRRLLDPMPPEELRRLLGRKAR